MLLSSWRIFSFFRYWPRSYLSITQIIHFIMQFTGLYLGPSINGLVTEGSSKLCCRGFVLALFQSTTAYKIDSEHIQDNTKLFSLCKVEIFQVTVNKIETFIIFLV